MGIKVVATTLAMSGMLLAGLVPAEAQRASARTSQASQADVIERVLDSVPMIVGLAPDGQMVGSGSGFLVDAGQGLVVTNEHVVRDRRLRYEARFPDGRTFPVEIVGAHRATDVALLRIAPQPDRFSVPLAPTDRSRVTDPVFAVGYPRGIDVTVSRGIVSAVGRASGNPLQIANDLQTDAPISPGNSGGPLLNPAGEVIGMNTRGRLDANSVGFAVPASIVRAVIEQLAATGVVRRATIGAAFTIPTAEVAGAIGIDPADGAMVERLRPDSPAVRAGLQLGDVITKVDGQPVQSVAQVDVAVQLGRPGTPLRLEVRRPGQTEQIRVGLELAPQLTASVTPDGTLLVVGGVALRNPGPADGVPPTMSALVIERVEPGSAAARAGAQRGMLVVLIGDATPRTLAEAQQGLRDAVLPAPIAFIPGNALDARFAQIWIVEE